MGYLETENCLFTQDGSCAREKSFKDFVQKVKDSLNISISCHGAEKRIDSLVNNSEFPLELRQEFESIRGSSCINCPIRKNR